LVEKQQSTSNGVGGEVGGGGGGSDSGGDCGSGSGGGVLRHEKRWYVFYRYLHVSPGTTQKCMLHDSFRYRNTRSRDPITLLSMDIVVETF
jgi:hypothetical protein